MSDPRIRYLKKLTNTVLFLLNRQQFHMHQIDVEQDRLKASINRSEANHKKLEHMNLIREYQLLLTECSSQLDKQQKKLYKYLEMHPDLEDVKLYQQADSDSKDSLSTA
ncbi:GH19277 [Drosophila grimshawi]|uniref:GH19277 n=1 Tax=Drosophila grimshawi TaxID=7222 RepID=B4JF98_DROGR|nr:GH19277 [Drosophila grimshawi]